MKKLEQIKSELETLKTTLKKRFKVEAIDIFGSYARKQATEQSDTNLLLTHSTINYDY
jgi:predicted nucleotidyltransferase